MGGAQHVGGAAARGRVAEEEAGELGRKGWQYWQEEARSRPGRGRVLALREG